VVAVQLDLRKKRILQAIIDEYIDTAEPVGSRYIARKHELGLSSATIRNEMADLEEMGYLAQPHTSAGRIPSDRGYRLYVDDIMELRELTVEEIRAVTGELDVKIGEINQILQRASAAMSRFTKYTTLAMTSSLDSCVIKTVKIVQIEDNKLYVILVSGAGVVKNSIACLPVGIDSETTADLSDSFQAKLYGKSLVGMDNGLLIEEIGGVTGIHKDILGAVLIAVADCYRQMASSEIVFDGAINILNFPEFRDVNKAKGFLELLEEKKNIANVVSELSRQDDIKLLIGEENPIEEIKSCSIVSTTYGSGSIVFGTIGVIGPKRMDYSRVVSTLEYVNKIVSREINKLVRAADETDK